MTSAALRRLRLLRDLDEALAAAYCAWPGRPPRGLVDMGAEIEIRLERAWKGGDHHFSDRCRPFRLPSAGARP